MAYLKPQAPLMSDEDHIYPITTADQIVKADGTRLDQNGVITVDQAINANQLNGKDAAYYTNPPNLLDNSYWALPKEIVNQRGFVSGSLLSEWSVFIDRWKEYNGDAQSTFTFDTSGGCVNGTVAQKILNDKFISGNPYTYAVYFMDGTAICTSGIVTTGKENWNTFAAQVEGNTRIAIFSDSNESIGVRFIDTGSKRIKGHALIPGAYTAGNLPPYVAPDPVLELAKCQTYFVDCSNGNSDHWSVGFVTDSGYVMIPLNTPVPMRRGAVPTPVNLSSMQMFTGNAWVNWPDVYPTLGYTNNTLTLQTTLEDLASAGITMTAGQIFLIRNLPMLSSELWGGNDQ